MFSQFFFLLKFNNFVGTSFLLAPFNLHSVNMRGNRFAIVFLLFAYGSRDVFCGQTQEVSIFYRGLSSHRTHIRFPTVILDWRRCIHDFICGFYVLCIYCTQSPLQSGKCRAPDKAPINLEIIISICQEEIKSALLQGINGKRGFRNFCSRILEFSEALDILNDGTLQQNTPAGHNRSKRDADEDLTNEERRVAGVR